MLDTAKDLIVQEISVARKKDEAAVVKELEQVLAEGNS
jgi:RNA polymerase-interacting CarD/CdnL/TRCF family regulator